METKSIEKQLLDHFSEKAKAFNIHFREVHLLFFDHYQEEIQDLKKTLLSDQTMTKLPTDTWKEIKNHLIDLRNNIIEWEEKQNPVINQPFWQEWKEESDAFLLKNPGKIRTSFNLEKFAAKEGDRFLRRQIKKFSIPYYRTLNQISRLMRQKERFINSGRKIYVHNFFNNFILLPVAQFLIDQWNLNLRIVAQSYDTLSKAAENLKDELLAAEKLPERGIYWGKVINPELDKIVLNYENKVKQRIQNINSLYDSMSANIETILEEISKKLENNRDIAGTTLLPSRKYNQRKINSQWRSISKRHQRLNRSWEINLRKLQDEWMKNIDLAQLQLTAARYWYETGQIIKNKFYNDIIPLFKEISNKINTSKNEIKIDVTKIEDESEIKNKMLLINRNLVRSIRSKNLPDLLNFLDPELFSQTYSGFIKRMYSDIETLPEQHIVLAQVNMDHHPPKIKSDKIALKDLLQEETFQTTEAKIEDINVNLRLELDASSRTLSRIDQVIEYNLEGALNKIREEGGTNSWQEAIDITQQGLERVEQNIEDLTETLKVQIDESLKKFDLIAADLEDEIQILGDNEELLKLKIRLTQARTKAQIIDVRKKAWQYIRQFLPKLLNLLNKTIKNILERYSKVRRLARLDVSDIQSELSFTQYLTDVENKISQMPYIYQRIFRTEPLEDDKFFVGRSEVLNTISQDFEDFKNNYHPLTAVVGEKGSGKTSTLNYARRNILSSYAIAEIDITHTIYTTSSLMELLRPAFKLPDIETIDDLILTLNTQKRNRICIIENIHNLFIRTIEGFQAIDDLLLLISKTRRNVFWIISCGRYAWEYLETVTKIGSYFKRIIHLEDLSTEDLKDMILARHQISGYGINYLPTNKIIQSRQYKKLTNPLLQQKFLEDYFFKRLSESAEGNIRVAIYFWLSAIDEFEESELNITLDIKSESPFLHELPTDEILSLAAFIQHEYLDEEKHAMIFNQAYDDSCKHLEKLYKKGLLIKNDVHFLVHPYLYRAVVGALKMRNII